MNKFQDIVHLVRKQWKGNESLVRYGHYDIGKNSYDILKINKQAPFVRLYKTGKKESFSDFTIKEDMTNLEHEFTQFMLLNMDHLFQDQKDEDFDEMMLNGLQLDALESDL